MSNGTVPPESYWEPAKPPVPLPPRKNPPGARLAVGAILSFLVASLLYGPNNVVMAVVFASICTAGIGFVAILFCCWLVGWVALEVWSAVRRPGPSASTP